MRHARGGESRTRSWACHYVLARVVGAGEVVVLGLEVEQVTVATLAGPEVVSLEESPL